MGGQRAIRTGRGSGRRAAVVAAVALALLVGALWATAGLWWPSHRGATLSAPEAHARAVAGEILLVDIRRPDEWAATGIGAGAVALDMRRPDFSARLADLAAAAGDRPVAVICARGVRSARLATALAEAGFETVIDVPEGMLGSPRGPGWLARGLPVQRAEGG